VTQTPLPPGHEPLAAADPSLDSPPEPTSLLVNGRFPRRRPLIVVMCAIAGFALAYAWSAELVDDSIGVNVASGLLGEDAANASIGGVVSGVLFALVSGVAGSFTACNFAVFGAVGPLVGQTSGRRRTRFARTLRPLGWLAAGMFPVSALYGALVGLFGTKMPQFSATVARAGLTPRIVQAMVTFGLIGVVMLVLGLASLGVIRDPLATISRRFPNAPLILMGALIGGFLIGRPYPLFREMFRHAADTHNPFYGALAFALQSAGNIVVMAALFLVLTHGTGGRLQRWLGANPTRTTVLTACSFLVAGVFTVLYWDVRILGRLHYLWFPAAPWS
jgi:hypothetical protein